MRKKAVSPAHRRAVAQELVKNAVCSQRMACRILRLARSTFRYRGRAPTPKAEQLRKRLLALSVAHPRYGYRRIAALLRREGWHVGKRLTKADQPAPSFDVAQFNRLKPAEIMAMPQPVPNLPAERLQNFVRLLLASCGLAEIPPDTPEWAVKAAGELAKCFKPPKGKKAASEDYRLAWQMGLVSGLMPLFELHQAPQNRLAQTGKGLLSAIRNHASQLPANEAAEVFDGLRDGEQSAARVTQLPQRTKIFALLVFLSPEVAACKSTGELYKRLLSAGAIAPSTDAREIRKVCNIIGLRYSDQ